MEFNLNYTPTPSPVKITHADKVLLIGSCFAENIGEKLIQSKFNCLVNPNGILFNPISISKAITSYIKNESNPKPEINNNLYFSFEHHGSFSSSTKDELADKIKNATQFAHTQLKEAKFLIITFGSAFAYRHIASNKIVANCHKLPQQEFKKELLSVEKIVSDYKLLFEELKKFNPQLNIILTVSPVKYLRDGIIENNLSKSILIQSVHLLTKNYFPAYELVNDDLRDYRFYKEDMAHPNEQAINYVWEKFSDVYFSAETNSLIKNIKEITQAAQHRPINENTEQHQKFKQTYLNKCAELEKKHPHLNFSHEKQIYS
ncbi:MAG: GSCFA domain-containing protein [Bacteroidia bacterium]|nr:GSCFA domain-containing protein [Bacteroidia bacterium]